MESSGIRKWKVTPLYLWMMVVIVFMIIFFSVKSLSQESFDHLYHPEKNELRKEGQLVTVQISKGSPVRIFVVGREEAKLDPTTMSLTVRRIKPYPGKVFSVDKLGNYFVVNDSKEFDKSREVEIVTRVKGKSETFRFDLRQDLE